MLLRRYAVPRFGDLALVAISQRGVRAWVAELSARGLAPATVQMAYQLLGKVMGAAEDAGMVMQSCLGPDAPRGCRVVGAARRTRWPHLGVTMRSTRKSWMVSGRGSSTT
jgi:hypothetical protein